MMRFNYIAFVVIASLLFACKAKKTQSEASVTAEVVEVAETPKEQTSGDVLLFSMERTGCFGRCPIYKLQVYQNGYSVYEGIRFVDNVGKFHATVGKDKLNAIKDRARQIDYFGLNDEYPSQIPDFPSTTTTLNMDGKQKKVFNMQNAPDKLNEFQAYVDTLFMDVKWVAFPDSEEK